jgi:hypothetical protein
MHIPLTSDEDNKKINSAKSDKNMSRCLTESHWRILLMNTTERGGFPAWLFFRIFYKIHTIMMYFVVPADV